MHTVDSLTQHVIDHLLTPDQVGERLHCSRSKVIKMIEAGQLPAVRLPTGTGTRRLYRVSENDLGPFLPPAGWDPADLLTIPDVARSLGVSKRKVYYLIANGDLPTVRLPSRVKDSRPFGQRVRRSDLAAFVRGLAAAEQTA